MAPLEPDGDALTVAAWNAKVGRGSRVVAGNVRDLIADHQPDVILLSEAQNYVTWLGLRFALKWRVYARTGWEESANCPVMVRRTVERGRRRGKGWGTVRVPVGWTFHNGVKHPGRTWTWVRVRGIPLLSVHRAWSPLDRNEKAGAAEADELFDWFAEHPGPAFAVGDMNHAPDNPHPNGSLRVAAQVKGETVGPDRIDHGIARGLDVTWKRGDFYGSDHRAVIYTLRLSK